MSSKRGNSFGNEVLDCTLTRDQYMDRASIEEISGPVSLKDMGQVAVATQNIDKEHENWKKRGACSDLNGVAQDLFFSPPYFERKSDRLEREAKAKAICAVCPVKNLCLEEAIANNEQGVWGGMNEKERGEYQRRLQTLK